MAEPKVTTSAGARPLAESDLGQSVREWFVVASFIVGAFLRIHNFWLPGLWLDEYGTWWAVASKDWNSMVQRIVAVGTQSPLYYLIVKPFSDSLGAGPFSLRLPSIVFGIGLLGLIYPLANKIFKDSHAALLALVVVAANEKLIWYAQEARPYSLALFCALLSFLFYLSLLEREKWSFRLGYLLATAGAFYSHFLFGLIAIVQILHLILTRGLSCLLSRRWFLTYLLIFLVCLPGSWQIASIFGRRETLNWIEPKDWSAPIKLFLGFLDPWVFTGTAFSVLLVGFDPTARERAQDYRSTSLLLLWLLVPFLILSLIPPLFGVSLVHFRHLLLAAPAALLVTAWLMASAIRTGWRRWVPPLVFLLLSCALNLIPPLKVSGTFSDRPVPGWSQAAELLQSHLQPTDLILTRIPFIEADMLASGNRDPLLVSAISWPLAAHLPHGYSDRMMSLPYHFNDGTRFYVAAVLRKAAEQRRVWIIGTGEPVLDIARALSREFHFDTRVAVSYGNVNVILLEQTGK